MRIRSTKPEFWTSEDIASMKDWGDRLLFLGLWSYVDDNGVGRDNPKLITADLFPLEDDPRDTLARVSRGLQTLSEQGRIVRYVVDGKGYLYINNWTKHQRIDKPNKPRYPAPTCEDAQIRDTLATPSRDIPEILAPGTGEQGNRGTGESSTAVGNEPSPASAPAHTREATDEQSDADSERPSKAVPVDGWRLIKPLCGHFPQATRTALATEAAAMLKQGIAAEDITAGLERWLTKDLGPRQLPHLVTDIIRAKTRPAATPGADRSQLSNHDRKSLGWAEAAQAAKRSLGLIASTDTPISSTDDRPLLEILSGDSEYPETA